jgi:hypothetical protein
MDNQSSPVQILSPTIPNSWCPSGDWADIFNSYNQLYLNNSTVNIPYLNQVTPQQIQTINQNILDLQNQLNALTSNVRSGSIVSPATGTIVTPITFSTAMPNSNYQIYIEFVSSVTTSTGATPQMWAIVTGTKTATGFSLRTDTTAGDGITAINWQVFTLTTT